MNTAVYNSLLGDYNANKRLLSMAIETITLQSCPSKKVVLDVGFQTGNEFTPFIVDLYTIDNEIVRGYLPSKVALLSNNGDQPTTQLIYYVNSTLPDSSRPFGDRGVHCFIACGALDSTITYPVDATVFVDQQVCDSNVWHIFIFGDDQYDKLVVRELSDTEQ